MLGGGRIRSRETSPPRRPPPRLIESERGAIVGNPRGDNVPRSLVALRLPSAAASSPSTSHLASTVVFEGAERTGGVGVSPFPLLLPRSLPLLRSNAMLGMRLQKEGGQKCPVINQKGRKLGGKKGTRGTNWLRVRGKEGRKDGMGCSFRWGLRLAAAVGNHAAPSTPATGREGGRRRRCPKGVYDPRKTESDGGRENDNARFLT